MTPSGKRPWGSRPYDPSNTPFDWMNGQTDMLLFSVKRDSPLIGTLDAINGVAIEDGDILTVCAVPSES